MTTDTPPTLPEAPKQGPEIIYISEEAKNVSFLFDPKAKRIVVHPDGVVLTEY